jgi:hypothetical protein
MLVEISSARLHHIVQRASGFTTTGIWSGHIIQLKLLLSIVTVTICLNKMDECASNWSAGSSGGVFTATTRRSAPISRVVSKLIHSL